MSISEDQGPLPDQPTTVEVDVHTVDVTPDEKSVSKEDSNGILLDPIVHPSESPESIMDSTTAGEETDEIVPLPKPLAHDALGRLTSQSSVMSDQEPRKNKARKISSDSTASNPPTTPKSPHSRRGTGLSRQRPSMLRRDSGFSLQESWRKRDATVRVKSSKNFVSFHNIYYTVPQGYFWQHKPPKVILNNVR